ncbi:MAG: SIMPL domain-containing protein [Thermomicrobiales bacterium]
MRSHIARCVALASAIVAGTLIAVSMLGVTASAQTATPAAVPPIPSPNPPGSGPSSTFQRTIAVSGMGTATLAPDIAHFSAGVTETDASVADAQNNVNTKTNAIIDALRQGGVDVDKDVKTSDYSVQPQYNYPQNGTPVLTGYRITNSVNVTVRDITKVGQLLDAVTKAGANQVGGVSFGLADPEAASRVAREQAVQNARDKADTLAKATGVSVGIVMTIDDESTTPPPPRPISAVPAANSAAGSAAAPPPIQTGETTVSVTVRITYAIA